MGGLEGEDQVNLTGKDREKGGRACSEPLANFSKGLLSLGFFLADSNSIPWVRSSLN